MAVLHLTEEGLWRPDIELEPVEFWPYTTIVYDVVMTGHLKHFKPLWEQLVKDFKEAGIKACIDNKSAFGLKDHDGKMWYFGFKDFRFDLGTRVMPDLHVHAVRKT